MSVLIKKSNQNIIQKVRVKMSCSCHATCICSCSTTDGFVAPHGITDAAKCEQIYHRIENTPINK